MATGRKKSSSLTEMQMTTQMTTPNRGCSAAEHGALAQPMTDAVYDPYLTICEFGSVKV